MQAAAVPPVPVDIKKITNLKTFSLHSKKTCVPSPSHYLKHRYMILFIIIPLAAQLSVDRKIKIRRTLQTIGITLDQKPRLRISYHAKTSDVLSVTCEYAR